MELSWHGAILFSVLLRKSFEGGIYFSNFATFQLPKEGGNYVYFLLML